MEREQIPDDQTGAVHLARSRRADGPNCNLHLPARSDRARLVSSETSPRIFGFEAVVSFAGIRFPKISVTEKAGRYPAFVLSQTESHCPDEPRSHLEA